MIPKCSPIIFKRGPLDMSKMVYGPINYVAMCTVTTELYLLCNYLAFVQHKEIKLLKPDYSQLGYLIMFIIGQAAITKDKRASYYEATKAKHPKLC